MHKSLKILQVVCGDNHPDISAIYLNLGLMYQDVDNYNAAIDCYMDSLYRNIALYGDQHIQVASCYQAIAHAYYLLQDFRLALEYQEKSHIIIKKLMPAESQYVIQSQNQLNQFMKQSVHQEKMKQIEKSQMGIGSGKRPIGANKPKLTDQEREEMHKRQRIEQYIKRLQEGKVGPGAPTGMRDKYKGGFLDMLEQRMRSQQAQEYMRKQ